MPNTADQQDTIEQIAQVMERWKEAFEAKDVDGMMSFYAAGTEFSAFDLMPPIEFKGGEMWRDNWVAFFGAWSRSRGWSSPTWRSTPPGSWPSCGCSAGSPA